MTVTRLGHHGDGIAEGPDGPIYVTRTLPGEVVEGTLDGDQIAAPRILHSSADRVAPPCRHAKSCGGCKVQHMSDDAVAAWKQEIVRRALAAQGLDAPLRPIETSPPHTRRRATFSGRRTKNGVTIGFHRAGSDQVIDTPDCHLITPALRAARPALDLITRAGASRKDAVAMTVTEVEQGLDIAVQGGKPIEAQTAPDLIQGLVEQRVVRVTWSDTPLAQETGPTVRFDGIAVSPPPGAFLQATLHGETALRSAVTEAVGSAGRILDLFAGCGTFALPLARDAEVHAVEGDAALTDALAVGWRKANGLKKVTTETRDLFRRPLLPDEIGKFDAVVLDPPRAGAAAQCAELAKAKVPRIAMVSCNPATFARDAATLTAAGYGLDWVQVVDQFRWSSHVELAAQLTLPHMADQSRP